MSFEFISYGKILESSSQFAATTSKSNTKKKKTSDDLLNDKSIDWCVTEKVHGANFSFHVDGDRLFIRCAKRTGFLQPKDDFFGYQSVMQKLSPNIQQAAMGILNRDQLEVDTTRKIQTIVFYGELFGGYYPGCHDNSGSEESMDPPVQTGIWYCPHKEFILFDIAIIYSGYSDTSSSIVRFLPFQQTQKVAQEHDLMCVQPLYIGPFHKAIHYQPIKFQTTIPTTEYFPPLSLPQIPGNYAEGIVVKIYSGGTGSVGANRPIFKIKIPEFSEMGDDHTGFTKKGGNQDDVYRNWIHSLINTNRIAAAVSKVGNPNKLSNQTSIVQLVLEDLKEESEEEYIFSIQDELKCCIYEALRQYALERLPPRG